MSARLPERGRPWDELSREMTAYLADLAASVATVRAGAGAASRTPVVY